MIHLVASVFFLLFVYLVLFLPGYGFVTRTNLLRERPAFELCAAFLLSLLTFAAISLTGYVLAVPEIVGGVILVGYVIAGTALFLVGGSYRKIVVFKFPLICLLAISLFSVLFIQLDFKHPYKIVPDPQPVTGYNYNANFDVKVLNVAQTNANDNSIPYRQAQFIINRSDPARDSFIDEWGVSFFQRTPLMGSIVAGFYTLLHEKPPIAYIWSPAGVDPHHTYEQFQVIASLLNALFILPAYFLFIRLFNRRAAKVALLFVIPSQFFLYNSFFTWPKSLVAFFVLFTWLLLFEKRMRYLILAGVSSGLAYFTHDLALLYLGASVLLLLYQKRVRDTFLFVGLNAVFMLPWLVTSGLIYKKPSTFVYYPISTKGIPQYEMRHQILNEFKHTSIGKLIFIRLHSLFYLASPYQLISSEGGQALGRRLWALLEYSIPGAVGIALMPASFIELFRKRDWTLWILITVPVIACVTVIGWEDGLGALHFAEAIVPLLIGLGVSYLMKLRSKLWLHIAYFFSIAQLIFIILYSYGGSWTLWLHSLKDILIIGALMLIVIVCGRLIFTLAQGSNNQRRVS